MGSKLQKNAIITGYINSYCLVCECYFHTDEDTIDHIRDVDHEYKLLAHPYLEKYGDNHIRKVNKGYFCEYCSLLLATAAKVSLHVREKTHYENKGTFLLRRLSGTSAVLAFDDLLIDDKAWHSLSEETCAICNEEFDNESIHKTESSHLLKLVQNKVQFGPDNNVYRKTDDSSFQCLTCNAVFALDSLNDHFTHTDHKKLYAKCQAEFKKHTEHTKSKASEKSKEVKDTKDDAKIKKDDVIVTTEEVEDKDDVKVKKDHVKVQKDDVKDMKAVVKHKKDDVKDKKDEVTDKKNPVDKNHNDVKEHNESKDSMEVNDRGVEIVHKSPTEPEPVDETTAFANGNDLTYNSGNANAFCRICETRLPATLRSMKEHVNGKEHKNRLGRMNQLKAAKATAQITKKPMNRFIEHSVNIFNLFHEDVVINMLYCITVPSFLMMTRIGARYRCHVCEVTVWEDDLSEHSNMPQHERAMDITPVITSLPASEFVREVRFGIFHCGYYNQIVPRWEEVTCHLQSREHTENKDACKWRLQRHLPKIVMHRREQAAQEEAFRMVMMSMFRH